LLVALVGHRWRLPLDFATARLKNGDDLIEQLRSRGCSRTSTVLIAAHNQVTPGRLADVRARFSADEKSS
jgi:SRSO17 transposase